MPKTVYFIRHAKSSWKDMSLDDFDRPLNKRGKRDAPFMAAKLREFGVRPDVIVSSTANRALTTARYFALALGIAPVAIVHEPAIYEAYSSNILSIVQRQNDDWETILVFGHNPGFTMVANSFRGAYIDNVPTCGIVKVEAAVNQWVDFTPAVGLKTAFYYPKQYFA
ncbi:MAG: histidine phosphatase family protein [Bacteroidota bacterium]